MQIQRSDVNGLLTDALWCIKVNGVEEDSRNGKVISIPEPIILTSTKPTQRVIFCEERKENPVFHFAECLWMMAGRQDSKWLEQFNPRMGEYAETNGKIYGAYGHRWRTHFGFDQIKEVGKILKEEPNSRRAVIGMWAPTVDLGVDAKDVPCNTHLYLRRRGPYLDMTVCNRSNDLVWGALGSNIVHFSFLLELIAHKIGADVGRMHQFTNNLHIYERHWHFLDSPPYCASYEEVGVEPYPIIRTPLTSWLSTCENVVRGKRLMGISDDPFFQDVAIPILESRFDDCRASDWRLACKRYAER
jgi:thymidylate synthase